MTELSLLQAGESWNDSSEGMYIDLGSYYAAKQAI